MKLVAAVLVVETWAILGVIGALLAQTDAISGGAGWVGAGLLGAVLSWLLLIHLPARDKRDKMKDDDTRSWIDAKDAQLAARDKMIGEVVSTFRQESTEQRVAYQEALSVREAGNDRRNSELLLALKVEFERLHARIEALHQMFAESAAKR